VRMREMWEGRKRERGRGTGKLIPSTERADRRRAGTHIATGNAMVGTAMGNHQHELRDIIYAWIVLINSSFFGTLGPSSSVLLHS
jgi:hypothetical protein